MAHQTDNVEYDGIIENLAQTAYDDLKTSIVEANPLTALSSLRAEIANTWNTDRDSLINEGLTNLGFLPSDPIFGYYDSNWSSNAITENPIATQTRGGTGYLDQILNAKPIAATIPGSYNLAETIEDTSLEKSNIFPLDMGSNAFIQIDKSSFGGAKWTGENQLKFQFFGATGFSDIGSASYASHDTLGRSESYLAYEKTETREFSLTLRFVAQGLYGDTSDGVEREVKKNVDWCRALTYPIHVNGIMYPPPVVLVGFGRMYVRKGTPLRCVVRSANVTYCPDESPIEPDTFLPYVADVELSFACVFMQGASSRILDASTILSGEF